MCFQIYTYVKPNCQSNDTQTCFTYLCFNYFSLFYNISAILGSFLYLKIISTETGVAIFKLWHTEYLGLFLAPNNTPTKKLFNLKVRRVTAMI